MNSENPYKKYESLFERWPGVRAWTVCGEYGMRVAGRHYTPSRSKAADNLTIFAMLFWGALAGYIYHHYYPFIWLEAEKWALVAIMVWLFLTVASFVVFTSRALKATIVLISPNHIQIGDKTYDARVQHKFTMDLHRKAKEEADAELRAQQRGQTYLRHKKYYREAFHIFFEYLGQRILVTDISEPESAERFLRALVAVDRIMREEKSIFAANTNAESTANENSEQKNEGYFGKRPALD